MAGNKIQREESVHPFPNTKTERLTAPGQTSTAVALKRVGRTNPDTQACSYVCPSIRFESSISSVCFHSNLHQTHPCQCNPKAISTAWNKGAKGRVAFSHYISRWKLDFRDAIGGRMLVGWECVIRQTPLHWHVWCPACKQNVTPEDHKVGIAWGIVQYSQASSPFLRYAFSRCASLLISTAK